MSQAEDNFELQTMSEEASDIQNHNNNNKKYYLYFKYSKNKVLR